MKRILAKRFGLSLLYLLTIHIGALFFFFLFRFILFVSTGHQFSGNIQNNIALQAIAFIKGVWFDNVIACYVLLLPLVVLWVAGICNYTAKWLYRSTAAYFITLYSLAFIISAANIPYFSYFFKTINSSIYNWLGYNCIIRLFLPFEYKGSKHSQQYSAYLRFYNRSSLYRTLPFRNTRTYGI